MARELVKKHSSSSLGSIKESMLTEAQFQAQHGTGWVLMDGRDVTGSAYATLTGNTTLPDARGQFLRGKNNGRSDGQQNPDGDMALGTQTEDAIRNITGNVSGGRALSPPSPAGAFSTYVNNTSGPNNGGSGELNIVFNAANVVPTASDNRPKNLTVNIFIKINEA